MRGLHPPRGGEGVDQAVPGEGRLHSTIMHVQCTTYSSTTSRNVLGYTSSEIYVHAIT